MGWASGFQAGTNMARSWIDTYNQAKLAAENRRVADANQQFQFTQAEGDRLRELEAQGYSFEFDPVKRQYVATPPSGLTTGQRPEILGYTPALGGEGYDDRVARGLGMEPQPTGYSRAQAVPAPDIQEQYAGGIAPYRGVVLPEATGDGGESYAAGLAAPNRLRPVTYGGVPVDYSMDNRPTPTAASTYSGDLPVPAGTPESSGPLSIYRPEDSDIYKGLTRAMATPERIGPTSTTFLGREYAGGLTKAQEDAARMNAYADVMAANGDPAGAQRMRMAAAQEQRAQESHALQTEAAQLQLSETKRGIKQREASQQLSTALNELARNKQPITFDRILELGAEYGLGPAEAGKVFTDRAGINQAIYEDNKVQRAQIAQGATTLADAVEIYNNNPLFANGERMQYKPTGDGLVVIDRLDKSGRAVFSSPPVSEGQALAYLRQQMLDPIAAEKFAMDVAAHNSAILRDQATIRKFDAEAKAAGADTKTTTGLLNFGQLLQDDIKQLDVDRQLMDPKSGAFKKNLEEREQKQRMLDVTQARIANDFGMGGLRREGAPPPADGAGVTPGASLKGTVIKAGQPFNWQGKLYTLDKDILWENIQPGDLKPYSGGAAAPAPAAGPAKDAPSIEPKVEGPSEALQKYGNSAGGAQQKPVNVADDTVLVTINQQLKKLGKPNPSNVVQVNALQRAKEERIKELQRRYGSMTQLITE